jgi:hypothetical protein
MAFGDRYIRQAMFSIITLANLYKGRPVSFRIRVYTDNPTAFSELAKSFPVEAICLSPDQLKEWSGINNQMMRQKILAIETVLDAPDTNLLYVDVDTFFQKIVDDLFEKISRGFFVMHSREWPLSQGRKFHPELCPRNLKFDLDSGLNVEINDESVMWNAGVIGICSAQKRAVHQVLKLNDRFYKLHPTWHTEQLSFSVILGKTGKLVESKKQVFHYWHNKEVVDKYLGSLQWGRAGQVQELLDTARWGKIYLWGVILFKHNRLKFKEYVRSLPFTYKLYLVIKPRLKPAKRP